MRRLGTTKNLFFIVIFLIVLSIVLGLASIYPITANQEQSTIIINDTFTLHPKEIYRQGLGAFHGGDNITGRPGENITVIVESPDVLIENFQIVSYSKTRQDWTACNYVDYTFTAGADYYEAIFDSSYPIAGPVHFMVTVQQPQVTHPFAAFTTPAKVLFFVSIGIAMLILVRTQLAKSPEISKEEFSKPALSKNAKRNLQRLIAVSLTFWLILLFINANPFGTFENWYTDHARHPYTADLFLKDGFSVFSQPLNVLASKDASPYQFVTWPEMPHLYPLGSILVFMPFGALLQSGVEASLVYKLEIAFFLVFAHICLYLFLNRYWRQNLFPPLSFSEWKHDLSSLFKWGNWKQKKPLLCAHTHLALKLIGVYVIYTTLIIFAADGMFDSIALLFGLVALTMFMTERYDFFFLFIAISIFFKYQTAIFLLPIILVGLIKLLQQNKIGRLVQNWKIITASAFIGVSVFTGILSAPYLMQTRPELVMNGINAFSPHTQIGWQLQSFAVLLTLAATVIYSAYMLNRNSLLSFASLFLLLPSFILPYFQNWYLPFIFVYVLIPQRKQDIAVTIVWLIFVMVALSFGGAAFNPVVISDNFRSVLRI